MQYRARPLCLCPAAHKSKEVSFETQGGFIHCADTFFFAFSRMYVRSVKLGRKMFRLPFCTCAIVRTDEGKGCDMCMKRPLSREKKD